LLGTCFAGSVLLASPAAMAHNASEHVAKTPGSEAAGYKRSVKTYAIPDVMLTDFDDRPVKLRDLLAANDPVMINFIFTTCSTICPVTTKVLSDMPAKLGSEGKRLRLISISIDPENDTPRELKAYAKSFQAGERWKFLTGRTDDVKTVQLAFDNYRGDKMTHEPVTLMRQASSKSWVRIDGFATPDELAREYRRGAP
jgi:protein SCO1